MWSEFFIGVIACVAFSFIPGYFLARALNQRRFMSLGIAPCLSIALYALLGILYAALGVFCTWVNIFVPVLCLCLVCYGVNRFVKRHRGTLQKTDLKHLIKSSDVRILAIFFVVAILITGYVFVKPLDGAASLGLQFDNAYHLNRISTMLEWGNWSSIGTGINLYYGESFLPPEGAVDRSSLSGFYPSAWHVSVALVADCLDLAPTVATNACTAAFPAFVFPAAMFAFAKVLFREQRSFILFSGICMLCFSASQWWMIANALMSNMSSLCLLPGAMALFIYATQYGIGRVARLERFAAFVLSIIAIGLSQPNCVFSLGVFLIPYCVTHLWTWPRLIETKRPKGNRVLAIGGFLVLCAAIWMIAYEIPFMKIIINGAYRPACYTYAESIVNILTLSFRWGNAQPLLAIAVITGIVSCLLRKQYRWVVVSYLAMCFLFFVGTTRDGFLDYLLTGFWYTDYQRLASAAALFAVPLAGIGLSEMIAWCTNKLKSAAARFDRSANSTVIGACLTVIFLISVFFPGYSINGYMMGIETTYQKVRGTLAKMYSTSEEANWYSGDEMEFAAEVAEIIDPDDVVLNIPSDGSAFAYAQDGLNVFYRTHHLGSTEEEETIRMHLNEISSNEAVQDAVKASNIKYVMFLDYQNEEGTNVHHTYDAEKWTGVDAITDDTPGFELVLSDGDKKLYRIVED